MSNFSVCDYLSETYGINVKPGDKHECPFCNHNTLSITKNDNLAKCFHPTCEKFISQKSLDSVNPIQEFLWELLAVFKCELSHQKNESTTFRMSWSYLIEERKVKPGVLDYIPIGIVPSDFNIEPMASLYREKLLNLTTSKTINANQQKQYNNLLSQFDSLLTELKSCLYAGNIAFFYTDFSDTILSIKFRAPCSKKFAWFKPFQRSGVFRPLLTDSDMLVSDSKVLLVEGEVNVLTFYSMLSGIDSKFPMCIALGGTTSVDWKTLKTLKNPWVLFQDNDDAGRKLAESMQEHRSFILAHSAVPDSDLDSFVMSFGTPQKAIAALNECLQNAKPKYRTLITIANDIHVVRQNATKKRGFEVNQAVSDKVVLEMKDRGVFYKTATTPYYFDCETKKLSPIGRESQDILNLLHQLKLNPTETLHKYVLDVLVNEAFYNGEQTQIQSLFYYNEKSNTFYWSNGTEGVYKITTDNIQVVDNGCDGILFLNNTKYQPFKRICFEQGHDYLQGLLLSSVNFDDDGLLNAAEQRKILQYHFYALFFGPYLKTKPLLCPVAEKGSGKSSLLRRIGQLIFGAQFDVTPLPEKQQDFHVALANHYFIALDNVDEKSKWLNDTLAICSTGGTVRMRELYTNTREVEIPLTSFIAINSRTPNFRRDDVAERLLILRLKPLGDNKRSEAELAKEIEDMRDSFLSWMIIELQNILKALAVTPANGFKTQFRIADFAKLCYRIAKSKSEEHLLEALFDKLSVAQSQFTLETDTLFDCLELYVDSHPAKWVSTKELHAELKKLANDNELNYTVRNPKALGRRLQHLKPNIQHLMQFNSEKRGGNVTWYQFEKYAETKFNSNTLPLGQKSLELVGVGVYE